MTGSTGAISTAMVLAAGLGTRMRPLTDTIPKPLVVLSGRTLLDHALDRLSAAGIQRAIVNVHYFADQIEARVKGRLTPEVVISNERDAILETGGGVQKALPHLGSGPFVVHNSDSVWSEEAKSNLAAMLRAFDPSRMDALLLLARRDSSIGYLGRGDFEVDSSGRLARRRAGEEADHVFTGVSILKPGLFSGISKPAFSLNVIFDRAIAANALFGMVLEGVWMHVGTPEALAEAELYLNGRRLRTA